MRDGVESLPDRASRRARPPTVAARLGMAVAAAVLTSVVTGASFAADLRLQIDDLTNQIVGLRAQLTDLESKVYGGAVTPSAAPDARPKSELPERISRRLAVVETEIDRTGEWQRRVAGRFDELENMIRRVEGRIERLVADVDFRLAALEQREQEMTAAMDAARVAAADAARAAAAAGQTVAPTVILEAGGQSGASIAREPGAGYEPSAAPRSLGTIPASDAASGQAALQTDGSLLPAGTPEEQYNYAFGLLHDARYEEAYRVLSRFIEVNPSHPLAENASYWRSETFYARQMFADAARSYALNLQRFPDGRKAPDNMVKLGMALLKLGRGEEACQAFVQLDQNFPDVPINIRRAAQQGRTQANCS